MVASSRGLSSRLLQRAAEAESKLARVRGYVDQLDRYEWDPVASDLKRILDS